MSNETNSPAYCYLHIRFFTIQSIWHRTGRSWKSGKSVNEVAGNIIDGDSKKALSDVVITAYSVNKKEKIVISDGFGRFEFDELKTGIYKLVFEKEGYRKVVREKVAVKTDETFQMRIEMIEADGFDILPSPFQFFDTK